jgi:hypothetical protein
MTLTTRASREPRYKEMVMRKILLFLMLWAMLPVGCGQKHFKTVSTEIAPTAAAPLKNPAPTAVYFSTKLLRHEVAVRPDTRYGAQHQYTYNWGPALQAALTRSVQAAYSQVTVVKVPPRPGEFERVIAFDVQESKIQVEFIPGYLRQEAKSQAEVSIAMEVLDGKSMRTIQMLPASGKGSSIKDASGFVAYAPMQFSLAMEKAIQQLSEIVSNLLLPRSTEPIKPIKGN